MTRGLCDTLNLPHLEDVLKELPDSKIDEVDAEAEPEREVPLEALEAIEAIDRGHGVMSRPANWEDGRDHSDGLEKLHRETLKHSQDIMDLGFNVDVRSARGLFEVAATMYRNAIDAKNSKRDAQLKMMKMMLDKRKLDMQEALMPNAPTVIRTEGVTIEDRNELIRRLREENSKK